MASGIAALILAAVLAVAGAAKLADRAGARTSFTGFGVPERLAPALVWAVALTELALAVALLPAATTQVAAGAAALLLMAFTGAIARVLAQGREVDCHCFGRLSARPVGYPTLARNALLVALAVAVAIVPPDDGALGWLGDLSDAGLVAAIAAVVIAGLAVLSATLMRRYGRLLVRVEDLERRLAEGGAAAEPPPPTGLTPGTLAPTFALADPDGATVTSGELLVRGRPLLLVFSHTDCAACAQLMPRLAGWQRDHADQLTIAVVTGGDTAAARRERDEHGIVDLLLDPDTATSKRYDVSATPGAVLIKRDGDIATYAVLGEDAIAEAVERVAGPSDLEVVHAGGPPQPGDPAPPIQLPAVDGEGGAFDGERLVVFWDTNCSFCARGLPELKRIDADPELPRLLVVARGSAEAMQEAGISGDVVIDAEGDALRSYGLRGTPAAVMVDAEGTIASGPAHGMAAVSAAAEERRLARAGGARG